MEEKKMRELNAEEMNKVSGGADTRQECLVHVWMHMGPGSQGEIYQCRVCGKIENRYANVLHPEKSPMPDPTPIPLN